MGVNKRVLIFIGSVRGVRGRAQWFGCVAIVMALNCVACYPLIISDPDWVFGGLVYPAAGYEVSYMKLRAAGDSLEVDIHGWGHVAKASRDYVLRLDLGVKSSFEKGNVVLYPDSVRVIFEGQPMTISSYMALPAVVTQGKKAHVAINLQLKDARIVDTARSRTDRLPCSAGLIIVLNGLLYRNGERVALDTVEARNALLGGEYERLARETGETGEDI